MARVSYAGLFMHSGRWPLQSRIFGVVRGSSQARGGAVALAARGVRPAPNVARAGMAVWQAVAGYGRQAAARSSQLPAPT